MLISYYEKQTTGTSMIRLKFIALEPSQLASSSAALCSRDCTSSMCCETVLVYCWSFYSPPHSFPRQITAVHYRTQSSADCFSFWEWTNRKFAGPLAVLTWAEMVNTAPPSHPPPSPRSGICQSVAGAQLWQCRGRIRPPLSASYFPPTHSFTPWLWGPPSARLQSE